MESIDSHQPPTLWESPIPTVFVMAFQYWWHFNMCATKSQMFLCCDLIIFLKEEKGKKFIDKCASICLNDTNSFAKTLMENLSVQGCSRELTVGASQCIQQWRSGSWVGLVKAAGLVMRHGRPVIGWDSVRSPRVISLLRDNQGGTASINSSLRPYGLRDFLL